MSGVVLGKNLSFAKRRKRVRRKIFGTSGRPRVSVFKSNKFIYAQAIDDIRGHTLLMSDGFVLKCRSNKDGAVKLAKVFSDGLKRNDIASVVFDKSGHKYHGVIASFADSLRDNGVKL